MALARLALSYRKGAQRHSHLGVGDVLMPANISDNRLERRFGLAVGTAVILFVMALIWRGEPFGSPDLARMARIILALGAGIVGATIPGFLRIDYRVGSLAIRAAGGLAVFLIAYFGSPKVEALKLGDGILALSSIEWIEFRAVDRPRTLEELNLESPAGLIIDLRARNESDQLGKPIVIEMTSALLHIDGSPPENFRAKYFVSILTGGDLDGRSLGDEIGRQSDATAISLTAGTSIVQSILHVSENVGLPGSATSWFNILNAAQERRLAAVDVNLDTGKIGRWTLHCAIDRQKSAFLVQSMIDEKGVLPRYFHAACREKTKWLRIQSK